jgi:non-ribosomal peptide synthase protein (TIGR01720 family)
MDSPPVGNLLEAIAIVGMAGRFPGASNIDEFWRNIEDGVESISAFTDEELLAAGLEAEALRHKNYVKARGVIQDVEMFDAYFFGINPREAEVMDPQHRLFLEEAHKALEHAGYDSQSYSGLIGVYAGAGANYYLLRNLLPNPDAFESVGDLQASTGNRCDHLSTRVSYKLNLKGPSISVQTACSTSLVAVHLACQGLLNYQCDMALAGGISIGLPQKSGYIYYEGGINSPDGHCRPFDADAQGTVGGSGVGVVALKRLADALVARDTVYAVIRATAINNDGSMKAGYTAPSIDGQAQVISTAQSLAGVSPDTVTYIEAHGTATPLGDPIEVSALKQAFRGKTERRQFCAIGSVKSNIGHLDAAAGVAGLLKTVLALRHKLIPPTVNYRRPNPHIDFENSPFYVNSRLRQWETDGAPRRAGVSSFGVGGTNAHAVLEEWLEQPRSEDLEHWCMLMISAKTQPALDRMTRELGAHLGRAEESLQDIAYTSQVGRERHPFRRFIICRDKAEAIAAIEEESVSAVLSLREERKHRPVVFMFPGQGAQHIGMCEKLYEQEAVFREELDACSQMIVEQSGLDVRRVIYPAKDREEQARRELGQTRVTQPALFAVEYSVARMWMRMGIKPAGMIGHSLGEYVCACIAGVMSLREAITLIVSRARLMQNAREGAMLSVGLSEARVRGTLKEGSWLSSVNEASHCVVGGEIEAINNLEAECREAGVWNKRLETSHAFHTGMMEEICDVYLAEVKKVKLKEPRINYLSNLSGKWVSQGEVTSPQYWVNQMRHTVRFEAGLSRVLEIEGAVLLEAGPGEQLSGMVRRRLPEASRHVVVATIDRVGSRDGGVAQKALGRMWLAGVDVDWALYHRRERMRVALPTYSFDRRAYWMEGRQGNPERLKKEEIGNWFYVPIWKQSIIGGSEEQRIAGDESWMILLDDESIGEEIGRKAAAQEIEVVVLGGKFLGLEKQREIYKQEIRNIKTRGKRLTKVVSLRGIARNSGSKEAEDLFYDLLSLVQAFGEVIIAKSADGPIDDHSLELLVFTNDMQVVSGQESLCPEKSIILGPCRVIPQEYPYVTCRSIDISLVEPGVRTSDLAAQIFDEMRRRINDPIVSYRGNRRWVQTHEAVGLTSPDLRRSRVRKSGVYLITGGLGGIGLELAHYLASSAKARLALIGRSAFPDRSEWERLLDSDCDKELKVKIRKLIDIEQAGGTLLLLRADIGNEAEVRAALDGINERFGPVNGVIHAAGVPGSGLIQLMTRERASTVLAPKVGGAMVLHRLFRGSTIDFMMLCSSVSSIIGTYGRADYCGANAFLDAFAQSMSTRNGPLIVSINWDGWSGIGMGGDALQEGGLDSEHAGGLLPREGVEVFARVLCADLTQVIVSLSDFNRRCERSASRPGWKFLPELGISGKSKAPSSARPDIGTDYVRPVTEAEATLADIWQQLLGIDRVGIHDDFFELGGDSVVAIQVAVRANQAGLRLSARQIFDHSTIAEMASAVASAKLPETEDPLEEGPAPLTPSQCAFFEAALDDPNHFNQSAMVEVDPSVKPFVISQVVKAVVANNDALWLRYDHDGKEWRQRIAKIDDSVKIQNVCLAHLSDSDQRAAIDRAAIETQVSLNLQNGPIARSVLFDLGGSKSNQLLIVIHHLAVDAISWRILLEEMETACRSVIAGAAVKLSRKITSFKRWAEKLREFAATPGVRDELAYWTAQLGMVRKHLPLDFRDGANTVASEESVVLVIDDEHMLRRLQDVLRTHHVNTQEVLAAALAKVLAEWTGGANVFVAFEGHGRESLGGDVDVSSTVGWFTSIYPVALRVEEPDDIAQVFKTVKEQLRGIPSQGMGYGLLRYLCEDARAELSRFSPPEVSFVYLGRADRWQQNNSSFRHSKQAVGPNRSARQLRRYLLEVDAMLNDDALQVSWRYSANIHRRSTVEAIAERVIDALISLISFAASHPDAALYTPSDFPEARISQQELEDIIAEFDDFAE